MPAEQLTQVRIKTRSMGSKHVPVNLETTTTLQDPENYREEIKDSWVKLWEEAIRKEIVTLEQNNT